MHDCMQLFKNRYGMQKEMVETVWTYLHAIVIILLEFYTFYKG